MAVDAFGGVQREAVQNVEVGCGVASLFGMVTGKLTDAGQSFLIHSPFPEML